MKRLLSLLACVICISCNNDDDGSSSSISAKQTQIDLVTGITLKDSAGVTFAEYGNPNVFSENILVSPNPAGDNFSINSSESIIAVWVLLGKKDTSYIGVNFENILATDTYSENEIESIAELKYSKVQAEENQDEGNSGTGNNDNEVEGFPNTDFENTLNVDSILINASELTNGYYRVFVKMESGIYWDNIYISNDASNLIMNDFFANEF